MLTCATFLEQRSPCSDMFFESCFAVDGSCSQERSAPVFEGTISWQMQRTVPGRLPLLGATISAIFHRHRSAGSQVISHSKSAVKRSLTFFAFLLFTANAAIHCATQM